MLAVQNISIWLLAPLLALTLMAAHELGRLVRWFFRHRQPANGALNDGSVGQVYLQSALGLLSLLIAFAFGAALERYNVHRDLVGKEALAIEAHYQDVLRVKEPGRTQLAGSLIHYLDAREAYSAIHDETQLVRAVGASEAAGTQLWLRVASVARQGSGPEVESAVESAAEMLRAAGGRRDALAARVAPTILRSVLLYALIAAGFMGYAARPGGRFIGGPAITLILLALAISLVMELDGPRSGLIRVDQTPLTSVVKRVREFEAVRRVAPPEPWLASTPPDALVPGQYGPAPHVR